ncbi:MAG: DUF4276 family protein [Kiritimatiellae bacterium]|nr:DUF4276 family protein [Kiritimatiellia bacterium]
MSSVRVATIVEGHGECEAVPELVRRIARDIDPGFVPQVLPPLRVPASKLLREGEVERSVEFARRKLGGAGGILVVVDCDWEDGCPAHDGPALLGRARQACPDLQLAVVLAKREYEAWFLAAAESLRGKRGLPCDLDAPSDPEGVRGAKEWLSSRMPAGSKYSEALDQPALTAVFDMQMARRSDSFDKCYREIGRMLGSLREAGT